MTSRHRAASLGHAAGPDLKNVSAQLGHASIVLPAGTYTSVLPVAHHQAAEVTARLILTTAPASTNPTPTNPLRTLKPQANAAAGAASEHEHRNRSE